VEDGKRQPSGWRANAENRVMKADFVAHHPPYLPVICFNPGIVITASQSGD
jgi:hypothetical protein